MDSRQVDEHGYVASIPVCWYHMYGLTTSSTDSVYRGTRDRLYPWPGLRSESVSVHIEHATASDCTLRPIPLYTLIGTTHHMRDVVVDQRLC